MSSIVRIEGEKTAGDTFVVKGDTSPKDMLSELQDIVYSETDRVDEYDDRPLWAKISDRIYDTEDNFYLVTLGNIDVHPEYEYKISNQGTVYYRKAGYAQDWKHISEYESDY